MLRVDRKPLKEVRQDEQRYLMLLSNHRVIVDTLPRVMERYIQNFWPKIYCVECLPTDDRLSPGISTLDRLIGNHNNDEKKINKELNRIAGLQRERIESVYEKLTGKPANESRQYVEPDKY